MTIDDALKAKEILKKIDHAKVQLERLNNILPNSFMAELRCCGIGWISTINITMDDIPTVFELMKCYFQNLIEQLEKELKEL